MERAKYVRSRGIPVPVLLHLSHLIFWRIRETAKLGEEGGRQSKKDRRQKISQVDLLPPSHVLSPQRKEREDKILHA